MSSVTGVILAAGKSTRFGSDKLLYEFTVAGKRQPLILHTLLPWFSVFDTLSIVIRDDSQKLRQTILDFAAYQHKTINLIECKNAALGMGHSLSAAIEGNEEADGWVVGLADMPFIPVPLLKKIYQQLNQGAYIVAPYYDGRRGHPVGLNSRYKDELLALEGGSGARKLLEESWIISKIETEHQGVLADIDSKKDLRVIEHFIKF